MSKLATIKIKDENFLSWKQQVLTAIRGYGLGGAIIPPHFISDNSGVQIYNPTYVAHQRQEQLLSSWLLSSISPLFFLVSLVMIQLVLFGKQSINYLPLNLLQG